MILRSRMSPALVVLAIAFPVPGRADERANVGPVKAEEDNIAEGHGRWHYQENIHYCRISRGSGDELIDDFNTCQDEGYGDQALVGELKVEAYDLIRRINSYIAYLRKSKQGDGE